MNILFSILLLLFVGSSFAAEGDIPIEQSNGTITTQTISGDITFTAAGVAALSTGSVGDNEIDYTAVTLSDFTNDVGYFDALANFTGTLTALYICRYNNVNSEIDCDVDPSTLGGSGGPTFNSVPVTDVAAGSNISFADDGDGTITLNVSSGSATVGDGDYGDVSVSGTGTIWTVDAVSEGVVTAHEAALTITESQISDLGAYLTTESDPVFLAEDTLAELNTRLSTSIADGAHTVEINDLSAAVTWANIPDLYVPESAVTQHEGALSISESQISDLQPYLTAETNDLSVAVTWVNVPDANITQSSVTQHEGALSISESQISDLQAYLLTETDPIFVSENTLAELNTRLGTNIVDGPHTTDTNANTICTGTTTYLDGEGTCDDLSNVYEPAGVTVADIINLDNDAASLTIGTNTSISGNNTGDQVAADVAVSAIPSSYTAVTPDVEAHLTGIDAAIGGLGGGHDAVTVQDTASVDLTLANQLISAAVLPAGVDHDSLFGFVAAEHIDWTADQGATNILAANLPDLSTVYEPAGITVSDISDLDADAATLTIAAGASISGTNTGDQNLADTVAEITDLDNDAATLTIGANANISGSNTGDQNLADTVAEITDLDNDAATLSLPANTTISAFGATLVNDADAATARTTLDVDQAGTDNSTDVTVTGENYIGLTGQQITANAINPDNLNATDFGDFTCNGTNCLLDGTYLTAETNDLSSAVTWATVPHEYGGLETDVSAYTGIPAISTGSTYELNTLAELNTALGGIALVDTGTLTDTKICVYDGVGGEIDCDTNPPAGSWDGNIANIDINGGTDIGANLTDADLIVVDDGANGTNRKSALSRIWTYISGKLWPGESVISSTAGNLSINWSNNKYWRQNEPTGTVTYTFTGNPQAGSHVQLRIVSDGTSTGQTFNWPAAVKWIGMQWTATDNKNAIISLYYDGTNYWAQGANEV